MTGSFRRFLPLCLALLAAGLTTSCASSGTYGVFKSYPPSFQKAVNRFDPQDLSGTKAVYASDLYAQNGAALLANWEMGAFYQIAGQYTESRDCFLRADTIARDLEGRAVISGRDAARLAASAFTNENVLEFKGEGFEKTMSRTLNALNFLQAGDLQGARVEVRKAAEYQELAQKGHQDRLLEAQKEDAKNAEAARARQQVSSSQELNRELAWMNSVTASVKNSFLNPFTYFLSGVVYELGGEPGNAAIDYKTAWEMVPGAKAIQRSAYRAALDSNRTADLDIYSRSFDRPTLEMASTRRRDQEEVIVVYMPGLIPQKQEVKFPIPMPDGGMSVVAFPVYRYEPRPAEGMEIISPDGTRHITEPLVDMRSLAVQALKEQWVEIAVRQVMRTSAKYLSQKAAEKRARKDGGSGAETAVSVLGFLFTAFTENADLRGWYSLPAAIDIGRFDVAPGSQSLVLRWTGPGGASRNQKIQISVPPGKKTLLFARSFMGELFYWHVTL